MAQTREEAYAACLATLRTTDLDRYLACLLVPEDRRGPMAALYAFNAELARIRDVVREPLPGEIRLQWWKDLVEGTAAGESQANSLAAGLLHAMRDHRLPVQALSAMTEARIFDLYDDPMPDRAAFEGYAGETASALLQLGALVLDPEEAAGAAEVSGHGGIAQSVAGCLLLMASHRSRHQVFLPADILAATGLDPATFLEGRDINRISAAVSAFVGYGRDHLAKARQAARSGLGAKTRLAFLTVALAEPVFARATKAGASVLEVPPRPSQLVRQWHLWRASGKRMF